MNSVSDEVVGRWRTEFESMKSPQAIQRDYRNPSDYWNDQVQHQWQGFLMARQSVVIELPEPLEFDDGHDEPSLHYWPTQLKNAIQAQGYAVSGE